MTNEIAERYAQGLFELARETGTVSEKKEQIILLQKVLAQDDDLDVFLKAVKISKTQKKELIDSVFANGLDRDMRNFLKLLVDKGRIVYLRPILDESERRMNEYLGIEKAIVSSARQLPAEDLEKIQKALETRLGKTIILETHIQPDLIAGIKVTVGNQVTDVTIKNKIDSMKEILLKGGRA